MADPNTTRKHEFLPWNGDDCLCKFCGQSIASISEGELCPAPETASAKPQTTTADDARDAARYHAMRAAHLTGDRFVMRVGHKQPGGGMLYCGVGTEAEYDRAVDEQMAGERPATVRLA